MRVWGPRAVLVAACMLAGCSSGDGATGISDAAERTSTTASTGRPTTSTSAAPPGDDVVAGSIDEADLGEPYLGDLTFVPPQNCSVEVTERIDENGASAVLEYYLTFVHEDPETVLAFGQLRVVELNGEPVPDSQQVVSGLNFQIPSFVIGPDGALIEVRGVDTLLDEMANSDPSLTGMSTTPGFVDLMTTLFMEKYWVPWYGFWIDWAWFEQPVETAEWAVDPENTFPMEVTSLGTTDDGLAAVRASFTIEGESVRANIDQVLGDFMPGNISAEERDAMIASTKGRVDRTMESVLDPHTLRPHSVSSRRDLVLTMDGRTQRVEEERLAQFDWDSSDCG